MFLLFILNYGVISYYSHSRLMLLSAHFLFGGRVADTVCMEWCNLLKLSINRFRNKGSSEVENNVTISV